MSHTAYPKNVPLEHRLRPLSNRFACSICRQQKLKDQGLSIKDVNCLACHDRTGTYKKIPAGDGMLASAVDLAAVAQNVGPTTRSALSCVQRHESLGGEMTCNRCHQENKNIDVKILHTREPISVIWPNGEVMRAIGSVRPIISILKSLGYKGDSILYGGRFKKIAHGICERRWILTSITI